MQSLLNMSYFNWAGLCAAFIGDEISLAFETPYGVPAYTLVSKPEGSNATIENGRITPDAAGRFTITAGMGSMSRTVHVLAFDPGKLGPLERYGATKRTQILRAMAMDPATWREARFTEAHPCMGASLQMFGG